jgi:hypothetical protein
MSAPSSPSPLNDVDALSTKIADLNLGSGNAGERHRTLPEADHSHVVEVSDFPENWADQDIDRVVQETANMVSTAQGGVQGQVAPVLWHEVYRLVWPDDHHVLVVFKSIALGAALTKLDSIVACQPNSTSLPRSLRFLCQRGTKYGQIADGTKFCRHFFGNNQANPQAVFASLRNAAAQRSGRKSSYPECPRNP